MSDLEIKDQKKFFYGWVILLLCFWSLVASLGVRLSFGAFITSWESEFNAGRSALTLVSALSLVVYGLFSAVAGRLSDSHGARIVLPASLALIGLGLLVVQWLPNLWVLAVFYGVVASVGFAGASNVTASAVVVQWFHKYRGLALGLVISGMAGGQMIIVPLSIQLVGRLQWKATFLIYGLVITFVLAPLVYLLMRSKPEDMGRRPYGAHAPEPAGKVRTGHGQGDQDLEARLNLKQIFRQRAFWLLTIPYFFCGFTDLGLISTHLIPFAEEKQFSSGIISLAISLSAAFNIIGVLISGHLSDHHSRSRLLACTFVIRAISFGLLLTAGDTTRLLIFGVIYGITDMAAIAPTSSLSAHLFGKGTVGTVFGFIAISHQLGAAAGSLIPGVLYDRTGSYDLSILLSTVILLACSGMVLLINDSRKPSCAGSWQGTGTPLSDK